MFSIITACSILLVCHSGSAQVITPSDDDVEAFIIFSSLYRIMRFNVDVTGAEILQEYAGVVVALDFDYKAGFYYWSEQVDQKIYRAPLEGGPAEIVVSNHNGSQVDGIAVDWVNNTLYWTDLALGTINRLELNSSTDQVVLIASNITNPRGIVLDPYGDMMYFTDIAPSSSSIQRARMSDGTQQEVIVSGTDWTPTGITIDYETNRLYFAEQFAGTISSCNLNGSDLVELLFSPAFFYKPFDISLYNDRVYFTDLRQHALFSIHKDQANDVIRIKGSFREPYVLHVVHPSRQPSEDQDYCAANNGRGLCQMICASYNNGYQCGCLNGYALNNDQHTCGDINECAINNGDCSHICRNLNGSYECLCLDGYTLALDGVSCTDNNECNINGGGCEYACFDTDDGFNCSCPDGYRLQADQRQCEDTNECESSQSPCPTEANCLNLDGSYDCECHDGYVYDIVEGTCRDIDECQSGLSSCTQRCDNRLGTYSCSCHRGFQLDTDSISCLDVNECEEEDNYCEQICINIIGSFVCLCNEGYITANNSRNCTPIECGQSDNTPGFTTSCTGESFGSVCILLCIQGNMIGPSTITCQNNGQWSVSTAECIGEEVNNPPHAIIPSVFTVPEDSSSGVTLGILHTLDADNHDSYTYTLVSDPSGKFYIDATDDTLRILGELDYETNQAYIITVTTLDDGTPPRSGTFDLSIVVQDVNESPSSPILNTSTIGEHASVNDLVGVFTASDPERQDLIYTMVSGDRDKFRLEGDRLIVAGFLNFEVASSIPIIVRVEDNGIPRKMNTATTIISVQDENDAPTSIQLSATNVEEATPDSRTVVGFVIGSLSTEDEDVDDVHTYRVEGLLSDCFAIPEGTNLLSVAELSCFDHETTPLISLTFVSMDLSGLSVRETLTLVVTDINEQPSEITLSSLVILEYTTVVGTLNVVDPDQGDTYQITVASGSEFFHIEENVLLANRSLRFTDYPAGINVSVVALDEANHTYTEAFTIQVQNVNDPPGEITWTVHKSCSQGTEISDVQACVSENIADTLIATAIAIDPDLDQLTWSLFDSGGILTIDQSGALRVGSDGLNYESTLSLYSVFIVAQDPAGLTTMTRFNIQILDGNDPPSAVTISNTLIGNNIPIGQPVAILQCHDEDTNDNHTLQLLDNAGDRFTIDGYQLKVNKDLRVSAGTQVTVVVQCSDGISELPSPATFHLDIIGNATTGVMFDVDIILSNNQVEEQLPGGTVVGLLSAVASIMISNFTFSIVGGSTELFSIENGNILKTTEPFDFEEESAYFIVAKAESIEGSTVQTFRILVVNINEPPRNIMLEHNSVHENQLAAVVGIITVIDPEGDTINLQIVNDSADAFELRSGIIHNSHLLVTKRALDFESESLLTISLVAHDDSAVPLSSNISTFLVNVLNVNEHPTAIRLSSSDVDENQPVGATVGVLTVDDPDSAHTPQNISCFLLKSAYGTFYLDSLIVKVSSSSRLDYEAFSTSGDFPDIVVECADLGGLTLIRHFEIQVNDVPERPTDIQSATGLFTIQENNNEDDVVAHLRTIDPDSSDQDTFQYSVSDPAGVFDIEDQQLLVAHRQLDYEKQTQYTIEITSTDSDGLQYEKSVTVIILDGNDPPTGILLSELVTIWAQFAIGTVIANLEVLDEDANQEHQFSIETQAPEDAVQIINGNQLAVGSTVLRITRLLQITIVVKDTGVVTPLTHIQTFTLDVSGVDLPPTGIQLTASSIVEESLPGTVIGLVQVEDPDGIANQRFYCVLLDDASGYFDLLSQDNGEIQLRVANSEGLDYEVEQFHGITVQCRDSRPANIVVRNFTITVLDGPERPAGVVFSQALRNDTTINVNPPDFSGYDSQTVSLSTVTIHEDAENGVNIVAYVTVIDANMRPVPSHQTTLEVQLITENEYNSLNRNGRRRRDLSPDWRPHPRSRRAAMDNPDTTPSHFVVSSNGAYILVGNALDYEDRQEYVLYVKATDRDNPNLYVRGRLRVVVLDIPEAPLNMILSPMSILESAAVDTVVGRLSLTDPDGTTSAYVYTLISMGTPFYLRGATILVQRPVDHEVTPVITVQVSVQELGTGLQLVKNFHIIVGNVAEPPTSLTVDGSTTVTIPETLEVTRLIGNLLVEDPDSSDGFRFNFFTNDDSHDFFRIIDGKLYLEQRLDAWATNLLSLFIEVTDPTLLSFRQVISVRVTSDDRCSDPAYCSPFASCLRGFCNCWPGYEGDGFICMDIDECSPYPCHPTHAAVNGCTNGLGGIRNFTCECLSGWTGRDCTIQVDACKHNQCNPLGSVQCLNIVNSADYKCECLRGFEGPTCDGNTNDCTDNQCRNGGMCIDGVGTYTCDCVEPYDGFFCDFDLSVCENVRCARNGTCLPLPSRGHDCRCVEPFLPDCSGCTFGYGGANCEPCEKPFTGQDCKVDSSVCDPNPCTGGGVCKPDVAKYTCLCPANLADKSCIVKVVDLVKSPTKNNEESGGKGEENGGKDEQNNSGNARVGIIVASPIALIVVVAICFMLCIGYRRYHKAASYKTNHIVPQRARYYSDSQQVMIIPQRDSTGYDPEDSNSVSPEPRPLHETTVVQEYIPASTTDPTATQPAHETSPEQHTQEENPPPYTPANNPFLASIPPAYKANFVDIGNNNVPNTAEKSKADLAVAKFVETLATPIGDRGTLVTKGSNMDGWEQAQLGLVSEPISEAPKKIRKKSTGRKLSVTCRLSVGAVAYPNPIFIPENITNAPRECNRSVEAVPNGSSSWFDQDKDHPKPPDGVRPRVMSKSSSDYTKQNPVFQESDSEEDNVFQ